MIDPDGSIWKVPGPADQPEITLIGWRVMQLSNGDRHFVGWNTGDREGRASTKIVAFDPATSRGATASGRVYILEGPTGRDGDGEYTWARWMMVNDVSEYKDVSADIQRSIDAANLQESDQ